MTTDLQEEPDSTRQDDAKRPTKGGDIIFTTGKGYIPPLWPDFPEYGDIRFVSGCGAELMRLCGDGKVIVRGEQVDDNRAAYDAFMAWIADAFKWNREVGGRCESGKSN